MTSPLIALTPGEPAGIGPDLSLTLAQHPAARRLLFLCDPQLLRERAKKLGKQVAIVEHPLGQPAEPIPQGTLRVAPISLTQPVRPGQLDPAHAPYVLETLRRATEGCLHGEFAALVTGPVHKGVINQAGIPFTGHTEFLAEMSNSDPVMMLTAPGLRVALATTHLPLKEVAGVITEQLLERVIRILDRDLRQRFRLSPPHIAVCGLNPHAGEGGYLGREEQEIIIPCLERLREEGLHLTGPLPADSVFTPAQLEKTDVVLAMYHDQGLPALKQVSFGHAVNVTLGLPFVRTSVDHGSALALAGRGGTDPGSLYAAVDMALALSNN